MKIPKIPIKQLLLRGPQGEEENTLHIEFEGTTYGPPEFFAICLELNPQQIRWLSASMSHGTPLPLYLSNSEQLSTSYDCCLRVTVGEGVTALIGSTGNIDIFASATDATSTTFSTVPGTKFFINGTQSCLETATVEDDADSVIGPFCDVCTC